jgi:hypothetical protein
MSEITCEDGCQPSTLRITRTYNSSEVIANRKERTIYSAGVGNRSFTSQADYISFKKRCITSGGSLNTNYTPNYGNVRPEVPIPTDIVNPDFLISSEHLALKKQNFLNWINSPS